VAGEGFAAGLVWRHKRDRQEDPRSFTGLLAMVDAEGERFAIVAVSSRTEVHDSLDEREWVAEFAISPTADLAEAETLRPVLVRRLCATGRIEAGG
jgi:hypothetical protein